MFEQSGVKVSGNSGQMELEKEREGIQKPVCASEIRSELICTALGSYHLVTRCTNDKK